MKKLISVLLVSLMLLSSVTVVMADDTTEYELFKDTDKTVYELAGAAGGFAPVEGLGLSRFTYSSSTFYLHSSPAVGDVGYGALTLRKQSEDNEKAYDPVTFAEVINGDNLYDYELQLEVQRPASSIIVADLEIGLGNYNAGKQTAQNFTTVSSVAQTVYLGNVLSGMKKDVSKIITIDVADILDNGNVQKFAYNGEAPNELTADNANLIAIKATSATSGTVLNFLKVISIKLVKKSEDAVANIPTEVKLAESYASAVSGVSFAGSEAPSPYTTGAVFAGAGNMQLKSKKASVGDIIYGHQSARVDTNTAFLVNSLFGDANMEDYELELKVKKQTDGNLIKDIEFGLACCNGASSYTGLPVSLKTVNANFDETYKSMALDEVATVTIPVKDILTKGNFMNIEKSGMFTPTFAVENVTGIAAKATATVATTTAQATISLESIKFIRKTSDITFDEENQEFNFSVCDYTANPAVEGNQAIVAYYNDLEGNGVYTLSYCDVVPVEKVDANNATVSLPIDGTWGGAEVIKAFLLNSMNEITPLTKPLVRTN